MNSPVTFYATSKETGGTFGLMELTVPPGVGPAPHIHAREAEIFYVLEGKMTFASPHGVIEAPAGTLVHGPKGTPHVWRNSGDVPARMLDLVVPGGFEGFFADLGYKLPSAPAVPGSPAWRRSLSGR
jgi:mannose-6-phosphate isomerase-like protein (cupin superfamily)